MDDVLACVMGNESYDGGRGGDNVVSENERSSLCSKCDKSRDICRSCATSTPYCIGSK